MKTRLILSGALIVSSVTTFAGYAFAGYATEGQVVHNVVHSNDSEGKLMSSSDNSLYQLIEPINSDVVGLFVEERPQFNQIVGYSEMGHIFLYAPKQQEYVVFYPYRQAGKSYGSFASLTEFEATILQDEGFQAYVLQPYFLQDLKQKHGQLQKDEVFIPTPYFGWDSDDVNDFNKGNIWVMLTLTNQFFNDTHIKPE